MKKMSFKVNFSLDDYKKELEQKQIRYSYLFTFFSKILFVERR